MSLTSSLFIKKSTVSGTIPTLSEITSSELAINLGDGGLFYSDVTASAVKLVRAGSASFAQTASFVVSSSFAQTASFALNAGAGGDGGGGGAAVLGDTFNYFDVDKEFAPTFSFNDEFTEEGTIDLTKWEDFNTASLSASLPGNSLLELSNNLTGTGQAIHMQPIPSGSWVARMKMAFKTFTTSGQQFMGFIVQNQGNDRLEAILFGHDSSQPGRWLIEYTNPSTFSSTDTINAIPLTTWEEVGKQWIYLEVAYDGLAALDYKFSYDGVGFDEMFPGMVRTTGSWIQDLTHIGFGVAIGESPFSGSIDWIRIGSSSSTVNGGFRTIGNNAKVLVAAGDAFNYFDADAFPSGVVTSSFNDEFTESGSLDLTKWRFEANSGSLSASQVGDSLLRMTSDGGGSGIHRITQPIPSGSWVVRTKVALQSTGTQHFVGLSLENKGNSRLENFSIAMDTTPKKFLTTFSDPSTFVATISQPALGDAEAKTAWWYLEIDYDDPSKSYEYRTSQNGISYETFVARTTASYLSGLPTHIGLQSTQTVGNFTASYDWFRIGSGSGDINGGLRTVGSVGPSGSQGPSGSVPPVPLTPPTASVSGTFVPSSIRMWYKADEGITTGAGGVTRWEDQSGFGNHMTQSQSPSGSAAEPAFIDVSGSAFSTLPVVRFDGVDDYLITTMSAALTGSGLTPHKPGVTIGVLARFLDQTDVSGLMSFGRTDSTDDWNSANTFTWTYPSNVTNLQLARRSSTFDFKKYRNRSPQAIVLTFDGDDWHAYQGAEVEKFADDESSLDVTAVALGIRVGPNPALVLPGNVEFAEAIVYDVGLNPSEVDELMHYLHTRGGLAADTGSVGIVVQAGGGFGGDFSGSFSGSLTGTLTGTLIGDHTGTITGSMIGDHTGTFTGSLIGDHTGTFTADAGTIAQPGYSFVESGSFGMTMIGPDLILGTSGSSSLIINDVGDLIVSGRNFYIQDLKLDRIATNIMGFTNMHFRLNAGFAIELNGGSNFIQGTTAGGGTVRVVGVGVVTLEAPSVTFDDQMSGVGVTASLLGDVVGDVLGNFTGSLEATGTLTGTLVGSASHAANADTAVLAVSAVTATTASNANTASFADPLLFTAHRPVLTIVSSSVYNVLFTDYLLLVNASSGTVPTDVVLPDTVDFIKDLAGKEVTITKIDAGANNVQVMASGTQTIIGDATATLTDQYQGLTLIPSGGIWWVK